LLTDRIVREDPGKLGYSEELRRFIAEYPFEREPIAAFARSAANELAPGSRVADVGAGDAPYREFFTVHDYVTLDRADTSHDLTGAPDIVADAASIPVDDASFDAVLLTQVIEHVPEPLTVLRELHRIIAPGGRLYLTAPFAWEEHEMPYDYARYTGEGLRHLTQSAGFVDLLVRARNDCFSTLAQLARNAVWAMGRSPDGLDPQREEAAQTLRSLADNLAKLAPLDCQWSFPLGYTVSARKPAAD
jgi:SAM-dependent methyltransferase